MAMARRADGSWSPVCHLTAAAAPDVDCVRPEFLPVDRYRLAASGYVMPALVLFTVVTNCLVCAVLLRRSMRTPTRRTESEEVYVPLDTKRAETVPKAEFWSQSWRLSRGFDLNARSLLSTLTRKPRFRYRLVSRPKCCSWSWSWSPGARCTKYLTIIL